MPPKAHQDLLVENGIQFCSTLVPTFLSLVLALTMHARTGTHMCRYDQPGYRGHHLAAWRQDGIDSSALKAITRLL